MIEVGDFFIAAEHVAVIKKIDKKTSAVFIVGQSATDGGFLVKRPALELATDVLEQKREFEEWKALLLTEEEPPEDHEDEEEEEEAEEDDEED